MPDTDDPIVLATTDNREDSDSDDEESSNEDDNTSEAGTEPEPEAETEPITNVPDGVLPPEVVPTQQYNNHDV